ncbi:hypothetical protein IJT10_04590 [bacterium]|nr:hypothetical protein [bacterium]
MVDKLRGTEPSTEELVEKEESTQWNEGLGWGEGDEDGWDGQDEDEEIIPLEERGF